VIRVLGMVLWELYDERGRASAVTAVGGALVVRLLPI